MAAAFILAGGRSSRMGVDKAVLDTGSGVPLIGRIATILGEQCHPVHIVAPPGRYEHLGLPVSRDLRPGEGPLAGIETALALELAEWNLVAACDMPNLCPELITALLRHSFASTADCILTINPSGRPEPLCSLYRRTALAPIRAALDRGTRKVTEALKDLQVAHYAIDNQSWVENLNTPEEWLRHIEHQRG
jgi:molybdenum cofactor guanylyltransferase